MIWKLTQYITIVDTHNNPHYPTAQIDLQFEINIPIQNVHVNVLLLPKTNVSLQQPSTKHLSFVVPTVYSDMCSRTNRVLLLIRSLRFTPYYPTPQPPPPAPPTLSYSVPFQTALTSHQKVKPKIQISVMGLEGRLQMKTLYKYQQKHRLTC